MALHGWAKTMIPIAGGYWADPMLANVDRALFGQDPWHLFKSAALGPLFAKVYVSWFQVTFGMMGLLAFSKRDHGVLMHRVPRDPDHSSGRSANMCCRRPGRSSTSALASGRGSTS
jgi:hypothetical protein